MEEYPNDTEYVVDFAEELSKEKKLGIMYPLARYSNIVPTIVKAKHYGVFYTLLEGLTPDVEWDTDLEPVLEKILDKKHIDRDSNYYLTGGVQNAI